MSKPRRSTKSGTSKVGTSLPRVIHSALGPVPVEVVPKLKVNGEEAFGHFSSWNRLIRVNPGPDPIMRHQTLYHEWMHMVLFDAGLQNLFTKEQQEMLCDAVGTARAVEALGRAQTKRRK
jgi:hypothetical protein